MDNNGRDKSGRFVKGHKSYSHWDGKTFSDSHRKNLSESHKGNAGNWLGKTRSAHDREKISKGHMGQVPWNKGLTGFKQSEETKRKRSESLKGKPAWNKGISMNVGDKNGAWKGGIGYFPYCHKFNECLKEKVRNRDDRLCQLCGMTEEDNGQKLSVHHIHYDKENCEPDLISTCRRCNSIVNFNCDYYEELFMNKLNDRGLLFWIRY